MQYSVASRRGACNGVGVSISVRTPSLAQLPGIIDAVASWQYEGFPVQVHPGDLGWYQRFGAEALAEALRLWEVDGTIVAAGFLDESELIRMAIAPSAADDHYLARRIADDFVDALDHVLPPGRGAVEARFGDALRHVLTERGWTAGESWTVLHRDLTAPVEPPALQIAVVEPDQIEDHITVEATAFRHSTLSAQRWQQMADGHAYRRAMCLVGYDQAQVAVAGATVWSAGHGRPGAIEPLGVHGDHRGRGHGVAITLAAAQALRRMGCSSATVATPSSNVPAVATYEAAGFAVTAHDTDFCRP